MANNKHKEHVSGLVDDEIDGSRGRFLLSRLSHDNDLRACWRRYHLYGDILRGARRRPGVDLTGAVAAAIADDPAPQRQTAVGGWFKPLAGIAVAASVAVAAFTGLYQAPNAGGSADAVPLAAEEASFSAGPSVPQQASVASATATPDRDPWASTRLQSYVLRHNEATARRGQGLVPYIYMVSAPRTVDNGEADGSSEQTATTGK